MSRTGERTAGAAGVEPALVAFGEEMIPAAGCCELRASTARSLGLLNDGRSQGVLLDLPRKCDGPPHAVRSSNAP